MNQKGFIPILFFLIILIVSAGMIGGVVVIKKHYPNIITQNKQSVTQSNNQDASVSANPQSSISVQAGPSIDETTNWKVYTNTRYGFSLKYPSELSISNDYQVKDESFVNLLKAGWEIPRMTILIITDSDGVKRNLDNLNTILSTKKLDVFTYTLISTQKINGQPLYVFSKDLTTIPGKLTLPPAGGPTSELVAMGIIKNIAFSINYLYENISKKELKNKDQEVFIKIISTLTFLN